jgi:hypothetical protein
MIGDGEREVLGRGCSLFRERASANCNSSSSVMVSCSAVGSEQTMIMGVR